MSRMLRFTAVCLLVCLFVSPAMADDKATAAKAKKGASEAQQIFAKLKSMAGDWVSTEGENKGQVAFSIRVIAGGSAVVEREFPGTPQEMVSVFHLDGDKVMLNHYCMLGNQPRMKASMDKRSGTIKFNFVGITNLASKGAPHMHEGQIKFVSKDQVESTWVMYAEGKAAEKHTFKVKRKPAQQKKKARRKDLK